MYSTLNSSVNESFSATSLLALESNINRLKDLYNSIPTLDQTRKWEFDSTSSKGTSAINKHHTRYHSQSVVQQTTAIDDSDKTTKYDDISENQQNDTYTFSSNNETVQSKFSDGIMQSSNKKNSLNDLSHMFGNMASANFFDAEINNGVTAGYQQLVMRSQLGAVSTSIEVPVVDIQRQLLLSHFIMG